MQISFKGMGAEALKNANFEYDIVSGNGELPSNQIFAATLNQTVTINSSGHFFSQIDSAGVDWGKATGLTGTKFQAFVLLHELGHLTGVFEPDSASQSKNYENSDKVLDKCFGGMRLKKP